MRLWRDQCLDGTLQTPRCIDNHSGTFGVRTAPHRCLVPVTRLPHDLGALLKGMLRASHRVHRRDDAAKDLLEFRFHFDGILPCVCGLPLVALGFTLLLHVGGDARGCMLGLSTRLRYHTGVSVGLSACAHVFSKRR